MGYLLNLGVAVSRLGNAVIGGEPWESLSGRAARSRHIPGWRLLGRMLGERHLIWARALDQEDHQRVAEEPVLFVGSTFTPGQDRVS